MARVPRRLLLASALATLALCWTVPAAPAREGKKGPRLAHMVFFDLAEKTDAAREKLVRAAEKYLSGHEGTAHFSVGTIAADFQRDVNDRDFDVALHLVFRNKAAHDRYQTHPRHLQFIEECKSLWTRVRVFDSYLIPSRGRAEQGRGEEGAPGRIALPDPAAGFAGMIRARVLASRDGPQVVVKVEEVSEEWGHSKAKRARALEGKKVLVGALREGEEPVPAIARFLASLRPGERVTLDVAHQGGEALAVLELTEEQRERAAAREE